MSMTMPDPSRSRPKPSTVRPSGVTCVLISHHCRNQVFDPSVLRGGRGSGHDDGQHRSRTRSRPKCAGSRARDTNIGHEHPRRFEIAASLPRANATGYRCEHARTAPLIHGTLATGTRLQGESLLQRAAASWKAMTKGEELIPPRLNRVPTSNPPPALPDNHIAHLLYSGDAVHRTCDRCRVDFCSTASSPWPNLRSCRRGALVCKP